MFKFFLYSLFMAAVLSCTTGTKEKYTVVLTYKEHKSLDDTVISEEHIKKFQADSNEEAYQFGINHFSHFAGLWNDTSFWARIEPLSFKVIDNNNVDLRDLIDKSVILRLDSLMWTDIERRRKLMSKAKSEFVKSVDTIQGGLTNLIDSLTKNAGKKAGNAQ